MRFVFFVVRNPATRIDFLGCVMQPLSLTEPCLSEAEEAIEWSQICYCFESTSLRLERFCGPPIDHESGKERNVQWCIHSVDARQRKMHRGRNGHRRPLSRANPEILKNICRQNQIR